MDDLIKSGVYASRSELIRAALLVWYDEVFYKSKGMQELAEVIRDENNT